MVEVTQEMIAQACDVMYWSGFKMCDYGKYGLAKELERIANKMDIEIHELDPAYGACEAEFPFNSVPLRIDT